MAMRKAMMLKRLVTQASQWVSQNPDKTRRTIDKVQTTVNEKTGGKYSQKLDKASTSVTDYFGIEDQGSGEGPATPSPGEEPGRHAQAEPDAQTEQRAKPEPRDQSDGSTQEQPGEGTRDQPGEETDRRAS